MHLSRQERGRVERREQGRERADERERKSQERRNKRQTDRDRETQSQGERERLKGRLRLRKCNRKVTDTRLWLELCSPQNSGVEVLTPPKPPDTLETGSLKR